MTSTARFEQMDFQTDSTEMVGRLERSIAPADRPKILIPAGHPRSLQWKSLKNSYNGIEARFLHWKFFDEFIYGTEAKFCPTLN